MHTYKIRLKLNVKPKENFWIKEYFTHVGKILPSYKKIC